MLVDGARPAAAMANGYESKKKDSLAGMTSLELISSKAGSTVSDVVDSRSQSLLESSSEKGSSR